MSNETPLGNMWMSAPFMRVMDGSTESHKENLAKLMLRDYDARDDLFPSYHLPRLQAAAREKFKNIISRYNGAS